MALTKVHNRLIQGSASNVKDFGAVGDGVADDTAAIQSAIDNGNTLYFPEGTYKITSSLDWSVSAFSYGDAILKMSGAFSQLALFDGQDILIEQLNFTGNNSDGTTEANLAVCRIAEGSSIKFIGCNWFDIKGYTNNQYGIELSAENSDVEFLDCTFKNITATGSNPPSEGVTPGFCGGIFMQKDTDPTTPTRLYISGCLFEDIFTTRNPSYVGADPTDYDADAIRLYIASADFETTARHDVLIESCRFHNIQKRAIKNTGVHGVVVNNIYVEAFSSVDATRPRMSAIMSFQPARSCTVSNVYATGRFSYLFRIVGSDIKITNVHFDARFAGYVQYAFAVEDRALIEEKNINISSCFLKGILRLYRSIDNTDGSGSSYSTSKVTLKDINAEYLEVLGVSVTTNYLIELWNCNDAVIDNVRINKGSEDFIDANGIEVNRTINTSILNCVFEDIGEIGLETFNTETGTATSSKMLLKDTIMSRSGEVDPTEPFIRINSTFENATITGCTFTIRSTASDTDEPIMRLNEVCIVENCKFYSEDYSTNAYLPFSIVKLGSTDILIKDCLYENSGTEEPWFFEILSNDAKIIGNNANVKLLTNSAAGSVAMSNSNPTGKTLLGGAGTWVATGNNLQY